MRTTTELHDGWTFKQADNETAEFLAVAQFPTNIHLDLLAHGQIPDPFSAKNELRVQWVAEKAWIYQTTFLARPANTLADGDRVDLVFEGLDTYATVVLNGKEILRTENMFVPERVDVTDLLAPRGHNNLTIRFESALYMGEKIVTEHPEHRWGCWNGDDSRLAVRKAQYHYGWDWGPRLITCGPWRPIMLECYRSRIGDLHFTTTVHPSLSSAEVVAKADIEGSASTVEFSIYFDDKLVTTETVRVADGFSCATFYTENPQLWYPAWYGPQPLYTLTAKLFSDGDVRDKVSKRFGIRKAEVVQDDLEDNPGKTFFFRVNNIPIFCGGSNWIPADMFIPRLSKERYRNWVRMAAESNQVMLRVWGGGIYEEQAFYDACDEYGMLVWQDFLFACGNYPAFPQFLGSVRREAIANVKRLRHHPSIVIWAGNNEDYQYRESEKLDYDPDDADPESWLQSSFPARYIYEKLLVDVTTELVPDTYYHFGSPFGGKDTRDPTVGDIHQWNVWHGSQEKYQDYDRLGGRFVSEFGMQALPNVQTIGDFIASGSGERYAHSSTMEFHNKAAGGERRLAVYLVDNVRYTHEPLSQYAYCTQVMQADCLGYAYRVWRRNWRGAGQELCGGALVWQLNDCWPATSWSIVDYALRPKLAYYALKRELAPVTVGAQRSVLGKPKTSSRACEYLEVWASNISRKPKKVDVHVRAWEIVSGHHLWSETPRIGFDLEPNRSEAITKFKLRTLDPGKETLVGIVVAVYLVEEGRQIARTVNWPDPLKYVHLPTPEHLRVWISEDASHVNVSAEVPVKAVAMEVEDDDDVIFSDNGVDIVPGEVTSIGVTGLKPGDDNRIRWRYLNMPDPPC